jgi:hypothetical protein
MRFFIRMRRFQSSKRRIAAEKSDGNGKENISRHLQTRRGLVKGKPVSEQPLHDHGKYLLELYNRGF